MIEQFWGNLWDGARTVYEPLLPAQFKLELDLPRFRTDQDAIFSDWMAVGKDIEEQLLAYLNRLPEDVRERVKASIINRQHSIGGYRSYYTFDPAEPNYFGTSDAWIGSRFIGQSWLSSGDRPESSFITTVR